MATWQSQVQGGLRLWNEAIFTDALRYSSQDGAVVGHSVLPQVSLSQADLLPYLRKTKEFLETLARYNTPGKLRNLRLTLAEVTQELGYRRAALRTPAGDPQARASMRWNSGSTRSWLVGTRPCGRTWAAKPRHTASPR